MKLKCVITTTTLEFYLAIFQHQIWLFTDRSSLGPGGIAILVIVQLVDANSKFFGLLHQHGTLILFQAWVQGAFLFVGQLAG